MKSNKKDYIIYFIISFIISLSINLKISINYQENKIPYNFIKNFKLDLYLLFKTLILSSVIIIFLITLSKLLTKIKLKYTDTKFNNKKLALIFFICSFITNLLFLLTYYPGSNMNDTLYIIKSPISMSSQHPIIYNIYLSGTYHFFYIIFKNANLSLFSTSIIQLIIMNIIIAYILLWFNKTFKNKLFTILLFLYFAFTPIIINYNTALIKDSLFSGLILLQLPIIYKIIKTNGECFNNIKFLAIASLLFIITSCIRNNGIYVVLFLYIILLIRYKKYLKNILLSLIIIIILSTVPILFSKKSLFQEKIAIPLQQIAYTITYNEKTISKDNRKYLNKIMDINTIKKNYNPYSVDCIKWNDKFNRIYLNKTKTKFIKTYLDIMPNNLQHYIKSYLLQTYGLYSIDNFSVVQSRFLGLNKDNNQIKDLNPQIILQKDIQSKLKKFYEKNTIFVSNGTCFIIMLILLFFTIYIKKYKYILLYIPLIGIWLTLMISIPVANAFRYMCAYGYLLPIIFSIIFIKSKS